LDGDGVVDEAEMVIGMMKLIAPVDRERLTNDLLNTAVMAALIGGFALSNITAPNEEDDGDWWLSADIWVYLLYLMAVHACTCSALISAFLYAAVNQMQDDAVEEWAKNYWLLLYVPMIKFVMGVMAYMVSIIVASWRDLEGYSAPQGIALAMGIMGVTSVWVVFFIIQHSKIRNEIKGN
jgi:hypothetical protein